MCHSVNLRGERYPQKPGGTTPGRRVRGEPKRPFTIRFDLGRDDRYGMFEYACHEGNYALPNIMSGQRFEERSR